MNSKFVKYLTSIMAIFYMAFGFLIAFTNALSNKIINYRGLIGGILIGYGVFRLVKIYLDIKRLNNEGKSFFDGDE